MRPSILSLAIALALAQIGQGDELLLGIHRTGNAFNLGGPSPINMSVSAGGASFSRAFAPEDVGITVPVITEPYTGPPILGDVYQGIAGFTVDATPEEVAGFVEAYRSGNPSIETVVLSSPATHDATAFAGNSITAITLTVDRLTWRVEAGVHVYYSPSAEATFRFYGEPIPIPEPASGSLALIGAAFFRRRQRR